MNQFLLTVFLEKPVLPQKSPGIDLDSIVCIAVVAVIFLFTVIKLAGSYRKNRRCPCCGTKTKFDCRSERAEYTRKWFDIRFRVEPTFRAVFIARCPKCGFEIELEK